MTNLNDYYPTTSDGRLNWQAMNETRTPTLLSFIVMLYLIGVNVAAISRKTGLSYRQVRHALHVAGLYKKDDFAISLRAEAYGYTLEELEEACSNVTKEVKRLEAERERKAKEEMDRVEWEIQQMFEVQENGVAHA